MKEIKRERGRSYHHHHTLFWNGERERKRGWKRERERCSVMAVMQSWPDGKFLQLQEELEVVNQPQHIHFTTRHWWEEKFEREREKERMGERENGREGRKMFGQFEVWGDVICEGHPQRVSLLFIIPWNGDGFRGKRILRSRSIVESSIQWDGKCWWCGLELLHFHQIGCFFERAENDQNSSRANCQKGGLGLIFSLHSKFLSLSLSFFLSLSLSFFLSLYLSFAGFQDICINW